MSTATSPNISTRIASRLAKTLGPRRYAMWFDQSARLDYLDDQRVLRVAVPNQFVADWIGRNFRDDIQAAAGQELGQNVELDLQIAPDRFTDQRAATNTADSTTAPTATETSATDAPTAPQAGRPHTATTRRARGGVAKGQTPLHRLRRNLEEFIVGPSNELAYAAARRLADADTEPAGPLFLHGGCGLGKTHLLQGITRRLLEQQPNARVLYTTGEQFTNEYIAAVRSNGLEAFRKRIRQLDLLAVDDIHFIANKQSTQQEFLHSFDQIELSGARVVLASDSHPKLIKQFSEALVSRCVRGLVVQVAQPDAETRQRLIEALAKRRGLVMDKNVAQTLATRTRGSVREIEGTLTKLQALASLKHKGTSLGSPMLVGHALVRQLFDHDAPATPNRPVRFETIIESVCERLTLNRPQICGNARDRLTVLGRAVTVYLTRELTSMSYPEIARAMGKRNHSSAISMDKRITAQLEKGTGPALPPEAQANSLAELLDELRDVIRRG